MFARDNASHLLCEVVIRSAEHFLAGEVREISIRAPWEVRVLAHDVPRQGVLPGLSCCLFLVFPCGFCVRRFIQIHPYRRVGLWPALHMVDQEEVDGTRQAGCRLVVDLVALFSDKPAFVLEESAEVDALLASCEKML
jgi:hypothetical protein